MGSAPCCAACRPVPSSPAAAARCRADRLIGHVDTTFEHQLLHVAEAQWEPVVQPDAMADDLGWKPEPLDTTSLQRSPSSTLPHPTSPAHQPDNARRVPCSAPHCPDR